MLKRRTPMVRTGLVRQVFANDSRGMPAPIIGRQLPALLKPPNYARADTMREPVAKHEYVRSTALLEACRKLRCQHCMAMDGTVCAAHSNWSVHGKGGHIKADDNRVAALCSICHMFVDQGSVMTEAERQRLWWFAHILTVQQLLAEGLWPAGVPVPDTVHCPFPWAEDEQ